jgi:hypothetical protein
MLVRFDSSVTGELLMFAEAARNLLQAIGKPTTARGSFVQGEMAAAAEALRVAVKAAEPAPEPDPKDESTNDLGDRKAPVVVVMSQRAWPLIDMLERTSKGGPKANIVWEAAADF